MIEDFTHRVEKPFHSSGYAQIASGTSMGSTSDQSFRNRYRIEQNRQHVGRYRESHLANAPMRRDWSEARTPQVSDSQTNIPTRQGIDRAKPVVIPPRTQGPSFREPRGRMYNPFS